MIDPSDITFKKDMSLLEFINFFDSEDKCVDYIEYIRWPNGIYCPFCGSRKYYLVASRSKTNPIRNYRCAGDRKKCGLQFSVKSCSIFNGTKIPLKTWLYVIYNLAINKKSTSSIQIGKNIGLTQKTAWGLLHDLRSVFWQEENLILEGVIEIDECYIAGGKEWKRWGSVRTRKKPILGMMERGGKLIIKMIDSAERYWIEQEIFKHVKEGSTIYTDGHMSYRNLHEKYEHDWVEHSTHEYVRKEVHTNNIEGAWGHLKKAIRNAHHFVSPQHAERYCNEFCYRYNNRNLSTSERFNDILGRCFKISS